MRGITGEGLEVALCDRIVLDRLQLEAMEDQIEVLLEREGVVTRCGATKTEGVAGALPVILSLWPTETGCASIRCFGKLN